MIPFGNPFNSSFIADYPLATILKAFKFMNKEMWEWIFRSS